MIFHIPNGSYFDTIIVAVGSDWKLINRYYKKVHKTKKDIAVSKDLFDKCLGFFEDDCDVLWLKSWKNTKADRDTLRHECHHITQMTLGTRRGMHNELEALAYHQDYLIEKISDILNREINKKRSKKKCLKTDNVGAEVRQ